jgi:hypothetical protein
VTDNRLFVELDKAIKANDVIKTRNLLYVLRLRMEKLRDIENTYKDLTKTK